MPTIGKHWPASAHGDRQAKCDMCKVAWLRSLLELKADGRLYCPDCAPGKDPVTLSQENAEGARQHRRYPNTGGQPVREPVDPTVPLPAWIPKDRTF